MVRGTSPRRWVSPLRYPGGKGKVANFMKLLLLENDLIGAEYVEPYAGGASVALALLYEEYASHIHINDINGNIYSFWKAVLEEPDELCDRIQSTPVTMEEWLRQREMINGAGVGLVDRAFATFFMNRTNRSGIISGGVIGGKNQDGPWKISARYRVPDLIRRIRKVSRYRSRITLTCDDAAHLLERLPTRQGDASLIVYLDPPYYGKGGSLYENYYSDEHHADIALRVSALAAPWVVSYDAHPRIIDLYSFASPWTYSLNYTAAQRYHGSEVMFFADGLCLPRVPSPARISMETVDELNRDAKRAVVS